MAETLKTNPYYSLKDYFLERYGKRVQKITVALPFTCPNRDGTKGKGGCTYCYDGSKPSKLSPSKPLKQQIEEGIRRARERYGEDILFFVYYQSYTNTYGDIAFLKEVYDTALEFEEVVGIDVGTRPDCAPEEVLELLENYTRKGLEVWIEYGLQSANFETLKRINRQHGVSDFVDAVLRTKKRPLKVCAHMIVGLPGESTQDFIETAKLIASLPVDGIKIHPLHVIRGTALAKDYEEGKFRTLSLEEYAEAVVRIIEILPPTMVVQRLTGETEEERLIAPDWCTFKRKNEVLQRIRKTLEEKGTYQGRKYPFWRFGNVR